jgi:hypothetical protein
MQSNPVGDGNSFATDDAGRPEHLEIGHLGDGFDRVDVVTVSESSFRLEISSES